MLQETLADLSVNFGIWAVRPKEQSTITKPIHDSTREGIAMRTAQLMTPLLDHTCEYVRHTGAATK